MIKYVLIPLVACSLIAGCGKNQNVSKNPSDCINAVIMTNANIYCSIDIQASQNTPWSRFASSRNGEGDGDGSKLQDMIRQYTGIKTEDMGRMVICLRSDDKIDILTMKEKVSSFGLESARGSAGLTLLKPVALNTIKTALTSQSNTIAYAKIEEITMGGMATLKAVQENNTNSAVFVSLAADGKTLLLSMNEASHTETLARISGSMHKLDRTIEAEIEAMPKNAQTKMVMIVPESVRKNIRDRLTENQKSTQKAPGLGLGGGFMKPFQNLQNVGLSLQTSTNQEICIYCNLGAETEAAQTVTLLQSLAIPLLSMLINAQTQKNGGPAIDLNNCLSVSSTGPTLKLNLNISTNDTSLQEIAKMLAPIMDNKSGQPDRRRTK